MSDYDDLNSEIAKYQRKSNISDQEFLNRLEQIRKKYLRKKKLIKQQQKLKRLSKRGKNVNAEPFLPNKQSSFGKSIPINKRLYNSIKTKIKRRVKRWPSAYASGQLVREYKRRGGKYRTVKFGNLKRWFNERWVDVCTGKPCGRKSGERRKYPYCRPSIRINKSTPRTKRQLTSLQIKRMCAKKHKVKGQTLRPI
jgi:hypothetical protein